MDTTDTMWPAAYLQPDPHTGCIEYATAYIARCLGHPDITAETVRAYRDQTRYGEWTYPAYALGHPMTRFWEAEKRGDESEVKRYWLGPGTRSWVEEHLARGLVALTLVHRIPTMTHAVVLLASAGDAGAFIMDPIYGHVVEPWDWFLGIGPGAHGCHHIDAWYSREIDPRVRLIG